MAYLNITSHTYKTEVGETPLALAESESDCAVQCMVIG